MGKKDSFFLVVQMSGHDNKFERYSFPFSSTPQLDSEYRGFKSRPTYQFGIVLFQVSKPYQVDCLHPPGSTLEFQVLFVPKTESYDKKNIVRIGMPTSNYPLWAYIILIQNLSTFLSLFKLNSQTRIELYSVELINPAPEFSRSQPKPSQSPFPSLKRRWKKVNLCTQSGNKSNRYFPFVGKILFVFTHQHLSKCRASFNAFSTQRNTVFSRYILC